MPHKFHLYLIIIYFLLFSFLCLLFFFILFFFCFYILYYLFLSNQILFWAETHDPAGTSGCFTPEQGQFTTCEKYIKPVLVLILISGNSESQSSACWVFRPANKFSCLFPSQTEKRKKIDAKVQNITRKTRIKGGSTSV